MPYFLSDPFVRVESVFSCEALGNPEEITRGE
jgi:hypothetical protein